MINKLLQKIVRWLNRKTLYPLLFEDWKKVQSPFVIQETINTGFFRNFMKSVQPSLESIRNVVVIAPHQDDEAIGCGGFLNLIKEHAEITIIFVTDGSQSGLGVSENESVTLRNEEAIRAAKQYNGKLIFLGLPNQDLDNSKQAATELRNAFQDINPDLILTPWLFDRPYKHRITNLIIFEALTELKHLYSTPIWNYQVHNFLIPNIVIDITAVMDLKLEMIRCYESQLNYVAPYDHYVQGMNQWNSQYLKSKEGRFAEIFFGVPVSEFLNIYEGVLKPHSETYKKLS